MSAYDEIMADAHEVFGFRKDVRPQERAHEYLERNHVQRGYSDTAMERVVYDLIDRARYETCIMCNECVVLDEIAGIVGKYVGDER